MKIFQVEQVFDFSWNLGSLHRPWHLTMFFHLAFQIGHDLICSIEVYHKAVPVCHLLVQFYTAIDISYIHKFLLHASQTTYFW